jgi:hypothetical protein
MSTYKLIRWGGLAVFLGGILWGMQKIGWTLFIGDQDPRVYPQPAAAILWAVLLVGTIFILLGLPALYARQAKRAGILGLIAFVMVFTGTALVINIASFGTFTQAGLVDLVAVAEGAGVTVEEPMAAAVGYLLTLALYLLGWIAFGLASLRAGVLPRWPLALVLAGLVIGFLFLATGFWLLALPVTEIGIAWLGFALWQEKAEALAEPATVA